MSTLYTNIFERFTMKTKDWTLDRLYLSSVTTYNEYVRGFLLNAIPKFAYDCQTDISSSNRDDSAMIFNDTLTELEEEILATMMGLEWTSREVKSLENLQRTLGDKDFKLHSGANALRQNKELQADIREEVDSLIVQYSWQRVDFDEDF